MMHFMHLKEKPFRMIWEGHKTIELRLYDDKRRKIQVGDQIVFDSLSDVGSRIIVCVTKLHVFESFEALYSAVSLVQCGYTAQNVKDASAGDMDTYYSPDEQSKYGVVGIEFKIENRIN